jgi:D-alanyl-D-alanine-carboxypeptidase/D-alanyl-D-alanine-endopeptidase
MRRFLTLPVMLVLVAILLSSVHVEAEPMTSTTLESVVMKSVAGDRTGACLAAAVVEGAGPASPGTVSKAVVCADPGRRRPIDTRTAFEIGSVGKTMTGMLLADLIAGGKLGLDDPLERHVPRGIRVPAWKGQPIRLRHLCTHTAGLPSLPARMPRTRPDNPYADLTEAAALASLADVELGAAPGTRWAYSNFGFMVLSSVLARAAGQDFEALLARRLFGPLGMKQAYLTRKPAGVTAVQGHLPSGQPTTAWDAAVNLGGAGDVRASLDDMVQYARAALGHGDRRTVDSIARSQRVVALGPAGPAAQPMGTRMGMGWGTASIGGTEVLCHEGGTGGFSSTLAVDRRGGRAVVLLADTALHSLGGLQPLAFHLLGVLPSVEGPRKVTTAPPELMAALAGRYRIADYDGLGVRLVVRGGKLHIHPDGQPELELGHDSRGDFFPLALDALLTPRRTGAGLTFDWTQGGGTVSATRLAADGKTAAPAPRAAAAPLTNADDYRGRYGFAYGVDVDVTTDGGRLYVQGAGQPRFEARPVARDVFVVEAAAVELTFRRTVAGRVEAVTMLVGGRRLQGSRR